MENVELEDETSWLEREVADIAQVNDRCEHLSIRRSAVERSAVDRSACRRHPCSLPHPCFVPYRLKENLLEALAASRNSATLAHVDAVVDMDSAADKALQMIEKIVFGEKVGSEKIACNSSIDGIPCPISLGCDSGFYRGGDGHSQSDSNCRIRPAPPPQLQASTPKLMCRISIHSMPFTTH